MAKLGRPTKYDPSFVKKVDEYLMLCNKDQMRLPLKEDFANFIDVDDDTLDNWANKKDKNGDLVHPEFFGALKKIMRFQKLQLVNDGIYGGKEVNSTIVKLLLQNNHGMKEKTETDLKGSGFLINVNTDAKSKLYGSGPIPAKTAGSVDNAL